ncbi:Flagellar M-ring protein [Buchnera aphidicola (Eriosoma grossulariae)]|uniref:flagellar basal-body MS-ring/collar protein FliF n=1 Tax=Buchnera aphidicola TaxID=9 RepID=UPI0034646D1D
MNVGQVKNSSVNKLGMNGFFSQFFSSFRTFFILTIIFLMISVYFCFFKKSQSYRLLYNHLSSFDGGAIVTQLKQMHIPYQFTKNSGLLLVPSDQIYEIRYHLAEQGLPKGNGVGFELLDKDKLGSSQFSEQINYQRALEGELARSILKINIIEDVRVHISLPKESLFLYEKKEPSASVVVSMHHGKILDMGQINAIVHLVSSSIAGLSTHNVTIIDELGHLLTGSNNNYSNLNNEQLNYTKLIEDHYSSRIEKILTPLVGFGNVHAEVTAKINFNIVDRHEDKYNPNYDNKNKSIRSEQSMNNSQTITENMKQFQQEQVFSNNQNNKIIHNKQKSHLNHAKKIEKNIINKNQSFFIPFPSDSNHKKENTINYELDHIISHIKIHTGDIKQLSAAVIVNYFENNKGKMIPLNHDLLKKMHSLIHESIGYSKDRKDTIKLVNAPFVQHKKVLIKYIKTPYIKEPENNLFFYLVSIIVFMLFFIFYYQYQISKYKKENIKFLSKKNLKDNQLKSNFDSILEKKNNNQIKKHLSNDIKKNQSDIINENKDNSHMTAIMIKKWMSGE